MRLDVQVVLFGTGENSFRRLLDSLERAAEIAKGEGAVSEVAVLVGDCSPMPALSADTVEELAKRHADGALDRFDYDVFGANLGSAEGNNQLLRKGDGDLVLLINPDCVAGPRLITELMRPLADPRVGIVEARQVPLEHPKPYDVGTGETEWASMACALLRQKTVTTVGPLDSAAFFLHCDDVDYSWRTRLAGYTVRYQPSARVFHDKRLSHTGDVVAGPAEQRYAAEGALLLAYKYSRPDVVDSLLPALSAGTPGARAAVAAFHERGRTRRLPTQLDPHHRVATFVDGTYSAHRF